MKKFYSFVLIFLIAMGVTSCNKVQKTASSDMFQEKVISNVRFWYPDNWEYEETEGNHFFYTPENDVVLLDLLIEVDEFTEESFRAVLDGIEEDSSYFKEVSLEEIEIDNKKIFQSKFITQNNEVEYEGLMAMFRLSETKIATMLLANMSGASGYDEIFKTILGRIEELPEENFDGILGSYYVDITLGTEKSLGFPKHERFGKNSYVGTKYTLGGTKLSYRVDVGDKNSVKYAEFEAMYGYDKEEYEETALNYLKYCVTLPYDDSNPELAQSWIEENLFEVVSPETSKSIVIGNAKFELYGTEFVKFIEIRPI